MKMIPTLAISVGDPAGIGPDIVLKAATQNWPCHLVAIADRHMLEQRAELLKINLPIVDDRPHRTIGVLHVIHQPLEHPLTVGQQDSHHAAYTLKCLDQAIHLCQTQQAECLVTGPINKAMINQGAVPIMFQGHTQYLAKHTGSAMPIMLFVSNTQKLALMTDHIPLKQVPFVVTKDLLVSKIRLLNHELKKWYGINHPKMAICGLNPHAGEQGYLGDEEQTTMIPAIADLRAQGLDLQGPFSADTLLIPAHNSEFDVIITLYHDQGLPAFKALNFGQLSNVTLGLPFLRFSVDHGTAYDLAGTAKASADSLNYVIRQAIHQSQSRMPHGQATLS